MLRTIHWDELRLAREIQHLYDHVLCVREFIENLCSKVGSQFCQCRVPTGFVIHSDSELDSDSDSDFKTNHSISPLLESLEMNTADRGPDASPSRHDYCSNVSIGPEFSTLCRKGAQSMTNATKYIFYCQQIDFAKLVPSPLRYDDQGLNLLELVLRRHRQAYVRNLERKLEEWKHEMKMVSVAKSQISETISKGQKSIRALEIRSTFPMYVMHELPTLNNLFYLHLDGAKVPKASYQWFNATKFPNLRALAVNDLFFSSAQDIDSDALEEFIEKATIYDDIHRLLDISPVPSTDNRVYAISSAAASDRDRVRFVNTILFGCPNLLSLVFVNSNIHSTLSVSDDSTSLQIPSSIEWLYVDSLARNYQIDLSQCKAIAGLHLINISSRSLKWPSPLKLLKIGCLCVDEQLSLSDESSLDYYGWPEFLQKNNHFRFDVQLYLHKDNRSSMLFDMSEDSSIIPVFPERLRNSLDERIVPKFTGRHELEQLKRSVFLDRITALWGNDNMSVASFSDFEYKHEFKILFKKIVEIMKIKKRRLLEYEEWFDINVGKWINYFGSAFEVNRRFRKRL
ncbi:hypothetical protein RFI_04149 [Reticulomyxa filosa]|uniref:Uncharacterized protein n=1 Tax=Reticulomyxa filosa TaxID=46433 RepID=X6P4G3_RETFI|nr:hypothetical protein RFI_04149 [Reticulomyxa filosa]|eukprot:ETO32959.1 hypothetical protein RFI_04149 [Reticulomyxa filosa]